MGIRASTFSKNCYVNRPIIVNSVMCKMKKVKKRENVRRGKKRKTKRGVRREYEEKSVTRVEMIEGG